MTEYILIAILLLGVAMLAIYIKIIEFLRRFRKKANRNDRK